MAGKHIVLAGGGHAHLFTLKRVQKFVQDGHRVTVIAPPKFWYSGMGPGLLGGRYDAPDNTVDIRAMVEAGGGHHVDAKVVRIEPYARTIHLDNEQSLPYDLLSLNLGSEIAIRTGPADDPRTYRAKPVRNFLNLREDLLGADDDGHVHVLIVGGGASGCEAAANLVHLRDIHAKQWRISLLTSSDSLLENQTEKGARIIESHLRAQGVEVLRNKRFKDAAQGMATVEGGEDIACTHVFLATGVEPSEVMRTSGLPVDDTGAMWINSYLQCIEHPEIFGGGDCVQWQERHLDRVGVYAVRASKILYRNLLLAAAGEPLKPFKPQKHYLLILNMGDGTGLLLWRGIAHRARWCFRLKEWLDISFMEKYRS